MTTELPATENGAIGELVPIPTFPFPSTVNNVELVVEATVKSGKVPDCCDAVETESVENGDEVPSPRRLFV